MRIPEVKTAETPSHEERLSELALEGQQLLFGYEHASAVENFKAWEERVATLLKSMYPCRRMDVQWLSLEGAEVMFSRKDAAQKLMDYLGVIRKRLGWLADFKDRPPPEIIRGRGTRTPTNEVFLVHGRNEDAKTRVKAFLADLGVKARILHEEPNKGQGLLDKFEANAEIGFAVVLATGDDEGHLAGDTTSTKKRARQNVVFELGFFIGGWSRKSVCVLMEEGVEPPSDYGGIMYTPFDTAGMWKNKLAGELQAANYNVDLRALTRV